MNVVRQQECEITIIIIIMWNYLITWHMLYQEEGKYLLCWVEQ